MSNPMLPSFASKEFGETVYSKLLDTVSWSKVLPKALKGEPLDDQVILYDLIRKIRRFDPLVLLSLFYFLALARVKDSNESVESHVLQQSHFELLQALALRIELRQYAKNMFIPAQQSHEIAQDLVDAFMAAYFILLRGKSREEPSIKPKDDAYGQALFVRNQGTQSQIREFVRRFFEPLEHESQCEFGFTVHQLFDAMWRLHTSIEHRFSAFFTKLTTVLRAGSRTAIWNKLEVTFQPNKREEALLSTSVRQVEELPLYAQELMSLCFRWARRTCVFSVDEVLELLPTTSKDQLIRAMKQISFSFGELSGTDLNHVFLGNPVRNKPLICLDEKQYLMAGICLFHSYPFEVGLELLSTVPGARDKFHARKGKILEDWIFELTRAVFGIARTFKNLLRTVPLHGEDGENDVLVFTDGLLLLIEAKSGEADEAVARAAHMSIRNAAQHLIAEPARQSTRLIRFLQRTEKEQVLQSRDGQRTLTISINDVRRVVRVSVTLEYLGMLSSRIAKFRDANILPNDSDLAPTMNLLDFDIVATILDKPSYFIHYLSKREELEMQADLQCDEQDWLGFFLRFGFTDKAVEKLKTSQLMGCSQYHASYVNEGKGSKPVPGTCELFTKLLPIIDQGMIDGWTFAGPCLLDCPQDLASRIDQVVNQLDQVCAANTGSGSVTFLWGDAHHRTLFAYGAQFCSDAVLEPSALLAVAEHPARFQIAVIGRPLGSGDLEYKISCYERPICPL